MEPVDSVQLFTWFFSTTDNPGAAPAHSMDEVLATALQLRVQASTDNTTSGLKNSHAPLSMASAVSTSSPALWAGILPPPALPMSNIKASSTPVRFSLLMLITGTKTKKYRHSSDSVSGDQHNKRACIGIKKEPIEDNSHASNVNAGSDLLVTGCDTTPTEGGREQEPLTDIRHAASDRCDPTPEHSNVSSWCSLPHVQSESSNRVQLKTRSSKTVLIASHSPNLPEHELINPPLVQPRVVPTLMMLWLWSTLEVWEIGIETPLWV